MTPLITLVVVALIVAVIIAMYNKLVRLRQNVRESWSAIDTELRRRYDLIPNLVETVKGYATHEKNHARRRDSSAQFGDGGAEFG